MSRLWDGLCLFHLVGSLSDAFTYPGNTFALLLPLQALQFLAHNPRQPQDLLPACDPPS
jgi:hypothetical protein